MTATIQRYHSGARMSKAVVYNGIAFLCGQTASGTSGAHGDIAVQTVEVLSKIDALLQEVGSSKAGLLAVTIHLRALDDFAGMNAIWESWLSQSSAPARTTVEAKLASPNLLVEMTVVAAVPGEKK